MIETEADGKVRGQSLRESNCDEAGSESNWDLNSSSLSRVSMISLSSSEG